MITGKLTGVILLVLAVMVFAMILRDRYIEQTMMFPNFTQQELQIIEIEENL